MDASKYHYGMHAGTGHHHAYLLPEVRRILASEASVDKRVFDLGCGNGSVAAVLSAEGFDVTGVDPSEQGIALAKAHHPELRLEIGSAYDNLAARYGSFPIVLSLEVVEHLYSPRDYAKSLYSLVAPSGVAIVSTPYHGYLKNLVLALAGKMDEHFNPLWDNGHIKFWSERTLRRLLLEAGFSSVRFERAGRFSMLAKSMIAIARHP